MANTLKFGNGNWATKDGSTLAYNDESGFNPLPFDFTRASSATVVNKNGLIETVASGIPRIDFQGNTKGTLLLEPTRSNLITNYTGANFTAFNGVTITANDSVSPDGTINATLITTSGATNELIQQAGVGIVSGQEYTISGYFKLKSGVLSDNDNAFKGLDGLTGGGIAGSAFNSSITNEWKRLSFTVISSTSSGRVQIKCENQAEILVWGLQLEVGTYATSIIKTSGSAVTRIADVCNNGANSEVINSTEGVFYAEIAALADDGTFRNISLNNGTTAQSVRIYYRNTTNQITVLIGSASGGSITINLANAYTFNKIAVAYQNDNAKVFVNGVFEATIPSITMPTGLNQLDFDISGSLPFYGKTKDVRVYTTALTDAELAALTSN